MRKQNGVFAKRELIGMFVVFAVFLTAVVVLLSLNSKVSKPSDTRVKPAPVKAVKKLLLGVYLDDLNDLRSFETIVGKKMDSILWYQSLDEDLDLAHLKPIAKEGRVVQLALEFWDPGEPDLVKQPKYRLKNITEGKLDKEIRRWARQMREFGYPIVIRPLCEMNGDWVAWGGTVNGNKPSDYIPAWRHLYDIFKEEKVKNVKWAWSPNVDESSKKALKTFQTYYPGDKYVDYVGMNGYNWGDSTGADAWYDAVKVFGYTYDVLAAKTSKPMIISETASTEVGGNKARWIIETFDILPKRFPRVKSLTWFNMKKETDWRVESSPASLQAFREAIKTK